MQKSFRPASDRRRGRPYSACSGASRCVHPGPAARGLGVRFADLRAGRADERRHTAGVETGEQGHYNKQRGEKRAAGRHEIEAISGMSEGQWLQCFDRFLGAKFSILFRTTHPPVAAIRSAAA